MDLWIGEFFEAQAKFAVWREEPSVVELMQWLVRHVEFIEWGLRNTELPSIQVIVVDLEAEMDRLGVNPAALGDRFDHFKRMLGSFLRFLLEKRGSFTWSKAGGRIKNSRYFTTSSYYQAATV